MSDTKKKPLRIPNRDRKGRFTENVAAFTPDDLAKAVAEFQQKTGEQNDKGTTRKS